MPGGRGAAYQTLPDNDDYDDYNHENDQGVDRLGQPVGVYAEAPSRSKNGIISVGGAGELPSGGDLGNGLALGGSGSQQLRKRGKKGGRQTGGTKGLIYAANEDSTSFDGSGTETVDGGQQRDRQPNAGTEYSAISEESVTKTADANGQLRTLLQDLRSLELGEPEVRQVMEALSEKHARLLPVSGNKEVHKTDPHETEPLRKQIAERDQQLQREQTVLQQANKKLKQLSSELAQEKDRSSQYERSFQNAIQQNESQLQAKLQDARANFNQQLQESQSKIMNLQTIVEQQGKAAAAAAQQRQQANPQVVQQLRDDSHRLKERIRGFETDHGRLSAEVHRLQSELSARDAQIKQGIKENAQLKDRCREFETRQSSSASVTNKEQQQQQQHLVQSLQQQLLERDQQASELRQQVDQLSRELGTAEADRVAGQQALGELRATMQQQQLQRVSGEHQSDGGIALQNVQLVGSAPPASSSFVEESARDPQQLSNLKATNERLFVELGEANKAKAGAEARLAENDQLLVQLKEQLSGLENASEHFSSFQAENERLKDEIGRLKTDLGSRDDRIQILSAQCDDLTRSTVDELSAYRRDLEAWQVEKEEGCARQRELEARLDAKDKESKEEVERLKKTLNDLNRKKQQSQLSAGCDKQQQQEEMESLLSSRNSLEAEVAVVQSQLSEANRAAQEATGELERVRRRLDESGQKLVTMEGELNEAVLARQSAEADKANIQLQLSNVKELQEELERLRSEIERSQDTPSRVKREVATVEGATPGAMSEMQSLKARNARLNSQLSDYRFQYAKEKLGLSVEDIDRYKTCFDMFDKDRDGAITRSEIQRAIEACGLTPNAGWVTQLLSEADADGSGAIEWPEFLKAMTGKTEADVVQQVHTSGVSATPSSAQNDASGLLKAVTEELATAQMEIGRLQTDLKNASKAQSSNASAVQSQVHQLSTANAQLEAKLSKYRQYYAEAIYGVSEEDANRYRKVFDVLDVNNNGCIAKSEIEGAIKSCGLKPDNKWVKELLREADESGNGVEWPAFLRAVTSLNLYQNPTNKTDSSARKDQVSLENSVQELQKSVSDLKSKLFDREKQIEDLLQQSRSGADQSMQNGHDIIPSVNVSRYTSVEGLPPGSPLIEEISKKDGVIKQLQDDLKRQQDKNNDLRQKNYKAVEAANQVEKVAQELSSKATKQLQEKYDNDLEEQKRLTQELITTAFPTAKLPSKSKSYRDWLQEIQKVVKTEVLRDVHTETTSFVRVPAASSATTNTAELESRVESLARLNESLESQLTHYKSILAQTEDVLKSLETRVLKSEDQWNERCHNYEHQIQKLTSQLNGTSSSSSSFPSSSFEENLQIKSLQTRLKKADDQWKSRCAGLEAEIARLRTDRREVTKEAQTIGEIQSQANILRNKLVKEEAENRVLNKELDRLRSKVDSEQLTGKELSIQGVKLRGMLKTGQDALKQEQEHVYTLQGQLKDSQSGNVSKDASSVNSKLAEVQLLLEKELMVNKQLSNKLQSLGVSIDTA
jgi:Ca2+-binding EF-hand superfamily protein